MFHRIILWISKFSCFSTNLSKNLFIVSWWVEIFFNKMSILLFVTLISLFCWFILVFNLVISSLLVDLNILPNKVLPRKPNPNPINKRLLGCLFWVGLASWRSSTKMLLWSDSVFNGMCWCSGVDSVMFKTVEVIRWCKIWEITRLAPILTLYSLSF